MSVALPPIGQPYPPEHIAQGATRAVTRFLSGHGTVDDLTAYRAWITWWRMNGDSEENLAEAIMRADTWATRFGLA
jgi:hypothetical protein